MTDFSYQLYSSRNFPPLGETLKMLAAQGYTQVEGYGALYLDDADLGQLRDDLDAAGLRMPTAHMAFDMIRDRPDRVKEIAEALGIQAVFGPHLAQDARPTDAAGWTAFGTSLGEAAKPLQDAGLTIGWHNHDFEFVPVDGVLPMDLILDAAPDISAEMDVAWTVVGGTDPFDWIGKHGDRIVSAHVKDIAPDGQATDEDGWADVGHGKMDWPGLMTALKATPCRWFVAEHDNPNDHERFASHSLTAMRSF